MHNANERTEEMNAKPQILFEELKEELREDVIFHFKYEEVTDDDLLLDLDRISGYTTFYKYKAGIDRIQTINQRNSIKEEGKMKEEFSWTNTKFR